MRPAGWLLLALFSSPSWGRSPLHVRSALTACGDPHATLRIHDRIDEMQRALLRRDGPCFTVTPDQAWELISRSHGLALLRRIPPVPGEPPLFFRPQDLDTHASPPREPASTDGPFLQVLLIAALALPVRLCQVARRRPKTTGGSRRALAVATAEIAAQRTRLRLRRLQLVVPDSYGTSDTGRWTREKLHFCNSRILPRLAARGLADRWARIEREVDRRIERAASAPPPAFRPDAAFTPGMDPIAYERLCATLLRGSGWEAQVTAAGSDQGTDIVARRGRRSMVLQCKLYGRPVGNSAVQQIAAARAHHRADFAAVVSNADFTAQARQLAATNEVYLLHHDELRNFRPARTAR